MRKVDVVIVGAGQAGLAASNHLSARQIDHVVLERGRVAEAWRSRRWDSFALNAPNWAFRLPGYQYAGPDPDAFMLRDELITEFSGYAQRIKAPVEEGVEVHSVERATELDTFKVATSSAGIETRAVVAATGPYQRRHRPQNSLDPSIAQLDSDQFRNSAQLSPGGVLVVGSGQTGCQIAEDLRDSGRDVWLATGTCGWIPRRYRGKDNVAWREQMGMFDDPVATLGHAMRLACPPIQTGVAGGYDINLYTLQASGINLTGRFLAADGFTVRLADDLQSNATGSDAAATRLRTTIDSFIADNDLDAPMEPPPDPPGQLPIAPTELGLRQRRINTVIWASGFRLDYSWIDLDLKQVDGYPEQVQGVSSQSGLYFLGLQLMHTRKSGLIFGVGEDAAHVAGVIARQLNVN